MDKINKKIKKIKGKIELLEFQNNHLEEFNSSLSRSLNKLKKTQRLLLIQVAVLWIVTDVLVLFIIWNRQVFSL